MQLLFFGSVQEALKMTGVDRTIKAQNLGELKFLLEKEYSFLQDLPYTFAVNEVLIRDMKHPIRQEDVIALLPPFSGG